MQETRDSIADIWGDRTPYVAEWSERVDQRSIAEPDEWVQSACLLCSNGCGLDIGVKDGRMVGVRGRAVDRVNRGRLGPKGLHGWIANESQDRLIQPLIRRNERLEPANWDDAMNLIVERSRAICDEFTSGAIGFYTTGQLFLEEYYTLGVLGKAGLGTPHMDGNTRLCTATAAMALKQTFGTDGQPGSYTDIDTTEAILHVGHNIAAQQTVLWMRILDRLAGSNPPKLVVIDPRKTFTAEQADVHLALKIGTNIPVLNGLLNLIIQAGQTDSAYIEGHTVGFEIAINPPGAARSDFDIFLEYARRMDFRDKGEASTMPEDKPKTVDPKETVALPDILPNQPIVLSKPQAWNGIIVEQHCQPPFEIPEHCLPQHLIAIQVGPPIKVENVVNGRFQSGYSVSGDLSVLPAHLPNWERWYGTAEYIALRLEPELIVRATEQTLEANCVELIPQLRIRDPLMQQMGLALLGEVRAGGAMSRLYAESMATTLAVHLVRHYSALKPTIKDYTKGLPKSKLRQAIEYINENLERDLTLAELAAVVELSPNYFVSLFKRSTGLSAHQYVLNCRIERAKALLAENRLPLIEVCHCVGFQSHSHFTKVFRKLMGTTPKAYREQIRS